MPWAKGRSGNPSGRPKNPEAPAADLTARRLALRAAGYAPIPVQGKDGLPTGWPGKGGASEEEVSSWITTHPYKTNTGALTRDMPTIDSDITRPDAADAVAETVRDWFDGRGVILTRFGQPPKRACLFRTDRPFKKLRVDYIDPAAMDPDDPKKGRHHVEILGDGQQIIVDGVHPVTKQQYSWHGGYTPWNTPRADLPELNEGEALTLLEHITEMLVEQFGFQIDPGGSGAKGNCSDEDASFRDSDGRLDVEATLASMPPSGAGANSVQPRCILSLLQKAIHPDDVMAQVVDATMKMADTAKLGWSRDVEVACVLRRCKSEVGKLYKEYDASDGTIPSWLAGDFHQKWVEALAIGRRPELIHSHHIGWHVRSYGAKEEKTRPSADAPNADTSPPKARAAPRVLVLRPFVPFDPATLPPRAWLYAKHYQRRTVSLTAGPGGMGKSSLVLVECVAMATARNLLGEQPTERLRIWLHNGEDPLEEILRRLAAICQHYEIPQEELQEHLWITSGNEFPLRVAKGYSNLEINEGLVRQISNAIGENHIDVAAFDPLVTLHSVSEGDPGKMDAVVRLFAGIADDHDAGVELNHHVRKPAAGSEADHDVHDIRGVMAITDAVRAARVLNRMNAKDAESAGVSDLDRLSHFRVDKAKGNYSPAQAATWRRFVNVNLPNTDDVGVVTPWEFPGQGTTKPEKAAADQKAEQVFLQLLDKFAARGINVSSNPGPTHAPSKFATEREAVSGKVSKASLKAAMNRLLDAGRIRAERNGRADRSSHRLVPWQGDAE